MKARDAPIIEPLPLVAMTPFITRNERSVKKLVKSSQLTIKRDSATRGSKTKKPKGKAVKKPPQPSGYEWRRNGSGWDLRKIIYVDSATSGKQRKRPYLGHLSKSAFAEMKKAHKGSSLDRAVERWIEDRDR